MAMMELKFRHQCRMGPLDLGVGEINTEYPEKPPISSGSDEQRKLVAIQIGPDGIEWCHYDEPPSL